MQPSHAFRKSTKPADLIESVNSDARTTTIEWQDGHKSLFHNIWLRDNCSCDTCGDHSGGARFFELRDIPKNVACDASVSDGLLKLEWVDDERCVTQYDPSWLRAHDYSSAETRTERRHQPITWSAAEMQGNVPSIDYIKAQDDDAEKLRLYEAVRTYGICMVDNVPGKIEATEELAGMFGYVRETHYGRIFEIISTPNPTIIANAPVPLRPHTDENFREPPPGIMIFHTIQASEDRGGVSVMTDGFKIAEDLKVEDPAAYELLSNVPIPHRRFIEGVGLRAEHPVLTHDYFGQLSQFRLNERTMGPIDLPPELMEDTYAALTKILEMTYDPKYHMHHLLESGQALVFDNARVMHARTGFNGNRHVRLTHIGSDEFYSRWRQLRNKLHGDINLI
ncbi:MAG: TauD/TfdA family dioxygenase [Chloroflexota bacterium]